MDSEDRQVMIQLSAMVAAIGGSLLVLAASAGAAWRVFEFIGGV